jgi:hypothetical protein
MAEETPAARPTAEDRQWLAAVVQQANRGDEKALESLRAFLAENPAVWRHVGDLVRTAERAWVRLLSGGDALAAESVRRRLAEFRDSLTAENATPVEKMLADEVVLTFLEARYLQTAAADTEKCSIAQAGLMLKRLDCAQRRHLRAIKSLTQLKELLDKRRGNLELKVFGEGERASA